MADTASSTRRSALASVAAVALTPFIPSPHSPAPTERGRQLLCIISVMRQAWCGRPDQLKQPEAFAAFETHYWRTLWVGASQLAGEIADQPLQTMDDVVDRAIVLAWGNGDVSANDIMGPILALGGVTFAQCDHLEVA